MKREQRAAVSWVLLFLLASVGATASADRGPSTAEERERVVRLTRSLESEPLSLTAPDSRKWLMLWVQEVPDVNVKVCDPLLEALLKARGEYHSELFTQMTFSSAAFVVENPEKAGDDAAVFRAGLEGTLRAYESIRKYQAAVRHQHLDDLLKKRTAGELDDFVHKNSKNCK